MAEDLKDIIKIIIESFYILLLIYVGYQVLRAVVGGTWATENIIIGGMGIILAGMFVIVGFLISQSNTLGKLEERTQNFEKRLDKLEKTRK